MNNNNEGSNQNERATPYAAPQAPLEERGQTHDDLSIKGVAPFISVLTRPRDTVRKIISVDPGLHVLLLISLAGIVDALDRASMRSTGDQIPFLAVVALAAVLGPLSGLIGLWIGSHLVKISGNWIGGKGDRDLIKTALAWATVPKLAILALWIIVMIVLGGDLFTSDMPKISSNPTLLYVLFGFQIVSLVSSIWAIVLLCNTIAEVQEYRSAWKGLANLLLASLFVVVPILLVVMIFVL